MAHKLAVAKTMPRNKSRGAEWSFAKRFQHACRKALATAAMNTAQVKISTPRTVPAK
jgi:ribosomal protein S5